MYDFTFIYYAYKKIPNSKFPSTKVQNHATSPTDVVIPGNT